MCVRSYFSSCLGEQAEVPFKFHGLHAGILPGYDLQQRSVHQGAIPARPRYFASASLLRGRCSCWQVNERLRLLSERGRGRGRGRFGGPGRPPYDPRAPERSLSASEHHDFGAPRMHDRLGRGPAADYPLPPLERAPGSWRESEPPYDRRVGRLGPGLGGRGSEDGFGPAGAFPERRGPREHVPAESAGRFGDPHDTVEPRPSPSPRGVQGGHLREGFGQGLGERRSYLDRVREPAPVPVAPTRRRVPSAVVVDGQQITAASSSVRCSPVCWFVDSHVTVAWQR